MEKKRSINNAGWFFLTLLKTFLSSTITFAVLMLFFNDFIARSIGENYFLYFMIGVLLFIFISTLFCLLVILPAIHIYKEKIQTLSLYKIFEKVLPVAMIFPIAITLLIILIIGGKSNDAMGATIVYLVNLFLMTYSAVYFFASTAKSLNDKLNKEAR
jgi:hypothetical protein